MKICEIVEEMVTWTEVRQFSKNAGNNVNEKKISGNYYSAITEKQWEVTDPLTPSSILTGKRRRGWELSEEKCQANW